MTPSYSQSRTQGKPQRFNGPLYRTLACLVSLSLALAPTAWAMDVTEETIESIQSAAEESFEEFVAEAIAERGDDFIALTIEEQLELRAEWGAEQQVEAALEEQLEEQIAELVEGAIEEQVASSLDLAVDEAIEVNLEVRIEEVVEAAIENAIVDSLEEQVEELVVATVEESIAEAVEDGVEEAIAATVEDQLEEAVAEAVEETIDESLEESIEQVAEASIEDTIENNVESSIEESVETGVSATVEERIAERVEDRIEAEIENKLEADETRIHTDQWLVMAEPEVFVKLAAEGYIFDAVTDLPGLGLQLAEVAAPGSFDISAARQGVVDVVGGDRAEVDLNHIYTAGAPLQDVEEGISPRDAIEFPEDTDTLPLKIGMIDSQVDVSHPALDTPRIESRNFAPAPDDKLPAFHGTAIASIIAAESGEYTGLAPSSSLYAASVFHEDERMGEIASTLSLVKALDWLVSEQVDVVNISLAGPPNRLLEAALKRVAERDVVLLAAAGNGGPVAKPMYPAAYDSVIAVTAVNAGRKVFRLANRGEYLDIAAPGVDLMHAKAGGGYTASSGTSFAVPFAATAAARLRQLQPGSDVPQMMFRAAEDLGPPGRDDIYGHGLLNPTAGLPLSLPAVAEAGP